MSYFFKKAEFIKSIIDVKDTPNDNFSEVIFIGRSNVGKSSLINKLVNQKRLAYTSSKPGHTRLLNYYRIEDRFYFVDAPGYGFSQNKGLDYLFYDKFINDYFNNNKNLKLVIFLLDSRRIPNEDDVTFYNYLKSMNYNYLLVMTKTDKLNQSEKSKIFKNLSSKFDFFDKNNVFFVNINNNQLIENLKNKIDSIV